MPRITISEKDLTINNEVDVTENVVYIPGMAYGLEAGPKLYTTVSDFIKDFGSVPYQFKNIQTYTDNGTSISICGAREYEKSYIYATELLNAGLPIMFDNIRSLYDYKDRATDDGLLQEYYDRLISGKVTSSAITDDKTTLTPGIYTNNNFEDITTYRVSKTAIPYTYQVIGNIKEEDKDTSLGLDKGYRFQLKLKYEDITSIADLPEGNISTLAVSNGTTNTYTKSAFEDDGSLIILVNVTKESIINLSIKWTDDIELTYMFTFNTCTLGEDSYSTFNNILDRWSYNIKFITTAGYPALLPQTKEQVTYPIAETMLMAATYRGDVKALIDDKITNSVLNTYSKVNDIFTNSDFIKDFDSTTSNACNLLFKANENRQAEDTRKYGDIVAPGGTYYTRTSNLIDNGASLIRMPGSFGYLLCLANSVEVLKNPDYFAVAGVSRGLVTNLKELLVEPTGADGEAVQVRDAGKISINPILYVQNYGYCIWGNRTLFPNPSGDLAASSFANIRVMSADVKKVIYAACKELTFETNSIELWLKFKSKVEPILEQMVANGALEDFELLKIQTTQKATLAVYVKLVTLYAVEDFDITIGLTDSTVEEVE